MKTSITMNKTVNDPSINIEQYEQLFCGIEFEFDGINSADVANMFKLPNSKTNGKGKKKFVQQAGSMKVELDVDIDLYKYPEIVTQVYPDGSVPSEVVCRPLSLKHVPKLKAIYTLLKDKGADFWANGKAGFHLTFLTDSHKELSSFNPLVVKNILQISRRFYMDIVKMFPGKNGFTRKTEYRKIPTYEEVQLLRDVKYNCIHVKKDENGKIWALEIRFPDGSNNFDIVERQIRFYMALIRQMAITTKYGIISFADEVWNENKRFYSDNFSRIIKTNGKPNLDLLRILRPSLDFYGYDNNISTDPDYEVKSKVQEMILAGDSAKDIKTSLNLNLYNYEKYTKGL